MGIIVFIRTLILGPLFSAAIFVIAGYLANSIRGSNHLIDPSAIFTTLTFVIIAAYVMVFIPAFGFMPGIFPLFAYSLLLSISTGPLLYRMSKSGLSNKTKIFATTILSTIIGITIYGGFYLLTLPHGKVEQMDFLWFVVAPTSAIFGAWSGLSYVRERS